METIQDMIETIRSRIWHLGDWGPSAAPASLAASWELSTAGTAGAGERGKKPQGSYLFEFCFLHKSRPKKGTAVTLFVNISKQLHKEKHHCILT